MNENKKNLFVAGHQPHYIPWIGYFSKIMQADMFCLVDSVQYEKKYFQNRSKIRSWSGEIWLTVPVITHGRFDQSISMVEIDNSVPWRRKHWKSIYTGYKKAPHFERYADFFKDIYQRDWRYLADLDEHIIRGVLSLLDIQREIKRTSLFIPEGAKTDLLIDICLKTGCGGYLSGTGGSRQYVDEEKFSAAGVEHRFQVFEHPTYPQVHGGFVPRMAIIDLLFNCGPDSSTIVRNSSIITTDHAHQ